MTMKVSIHPDGYPGGRLETSFFVAITCMPCKRIKPNVLRSDFSTTSVTLSSSSEAQEAHLIPELVRDMYDLSENDAPCQLFSELGLRSKDDEWKSLTEALPDV